MLIHVNFWSHYIVYAGTRATSDSGTGHMLHALAIILVYARAFRFSQPFEDGFYLADANAIGKHMC